MANPHDLPDLNAMRLGVEYTFPIQVRAWRHIVRPVTVGEHMSINNQIISDLTAAPANMRHAINENWLLAKYMLKYASKPDPRDTREGTITDILLDNMTIDEVLYAYQQYLDGTDRVNPKLEEIPLEKLNALAQDLKKNPLGMTELSSWQLVNLVRFLLTNGG